MKIQKMYGKRPQVYSIILEDPAFAQENLVTKPEVNHLKIWRITDFSP